jgi:ABC-type transporter Mla subunit MlaD
MRQKYYMYTNEYADRASFPETGEGGLLYRARNTGYFYLCLLEDPTRYRPVAAIITNNLLGNEEDLAPSVYAVNQALTALEQQINDARQEAADALAEAKQQLQTAITNVAQALTDFRTEATTAIERNAADIAGILENLETVDNALDALNTAIQSLIVSLNTVDQKYWKLYQELNAKVMEFNTTVNQVMNDLEPRVAALETCIDGGEL